MVARDGVEPPTPAFLAALYQFSRRFCRGGAVATLYFSSHNASYRRFHVTLQRFKVVTSETPGRMRPLPVPSISPREYPGRPVQNF
jgi:hypothetical protein